MIKKLVVITISEYHVQTKNKSKNLKRALIFLNCIYIADPLHVRTYYYKIERLTLIIIILTPDLSILISFTKADQEEEDPSTVSPSSPPLLQL